MKLKIKPAYIGLFLIGIMFFSTFAFTILQSFNLGDTTGQKTDLPKTNIINYRLTTNQESTLISQGKTIMIYEYDESCQYCQQQKQFLQQIVTNSKPITGTDISNQLFLELLPSNNEMPTLTLISYYGQNELTNATNSETFSALCQVLISKPIGCALK